MDEASPGYRASLSTGRSSLGRAVDDRRLPGQFILTGSAVPADDGTRHTGAGRLTRLRMRPLSLFELGRSSGEFWLAGLLAGERSGAARSLVLLDDLTAAALLDRLLHCCHIVNIRGDSYRMRPHMEISKAVHPTASRARDAEDARQREGS